jgi:hypothetical protein
MADLLYAREKGFSLKNRLQDNVLGFQSLFHNLKIYIIKKLDGNTYLHIRLFIIVNYL